MCSASNSDRVRRTNSDRNELHTGADAYSSLSNFALPVSEIEPNGQEFYTALRALLYHVAEVRLL